MPALAPLFTLAELDAAETVVRRHVPPTPQYAWPLLAEAVGTETWVKHENHTPTGAFKVRGGQVYFDQLARSLVPRGSVHLDHDRRLDDAPMSQTRRVCGSLVPRSRNDVAGVVTATRGNHGQSVAFAGSAVGIPTTVVVPLGNSPEKNAATIAFGATLIEHGHDFQAAREHAGRLADERGLVMLPPFRPELVTGVATYAREFLVGAPPLDAVYVPVGMGSGICGLIGVRDLLGLATEIIGVVAQQAPATQLSFAAGHVVSTDRAATFIDGVACRVPDDTAIATIVRGAERIVTVTEDACAEAVRVMLRATHNVAEPAGAIALAGLLGERDAQRGRRVGVILTGGNIDGPMLADILAGRTPAP